MDDHHGMKGTGSGDPRSVPGVGKASARSKEGSATVPRDRPFALDRRVNSTNHNGLRCPRAVLVAVGSASSAPHPRGSATITVALRLRAHELTTGGNLRKPNLDAGSFPYLCREASNVVKTRNARHRGPIKVHAIDAELSPKFGSPPNRDAEVANVRSAARRHRDR